MNPTTAPPSGPMPVQGAGAEARDIAAVCCCSAGVDRKVDEERVVSWLKLACPFDSILLAYNDAVGALARRALSARAPPPVLNLRMVVLQAAAVPACVACAPIIPS